MNEIKRLMTDEDVNLAYKYIGYYWYKAFNVVKKDKKKAEKYAELMRIALEDIKSTGEVKSKEVLDDFDEIECKYMNVSFSEFYDIEKPLEDVGEEFSEKFKKFGKNIDVTGKTDVTDVKYLHLEIEYYDISEHHEEEEEEINPDFEEYETIGTYMNVSLTVKNY